MKLNPEILEAIRRAVEHYGNTSQFAKEIGVAHSTVLFWLSGKTNNINGTIWDQRVKRVLRKFMPAPAGRKTVALHDPAASFNSAPAVRPVEKDPVKSVPAIPLSRMNEFDITMQSPVSFARQAPVAEIPFANDCTEFSFALLLDDPKFCPELPLGSRLLICGSNYADDGDIVIVKTRNPAKLYLARLHRSSDGKTRLEPLNSKLPEMCWDTAVNAEKVFWIFPVSEISIDLNACRWEQNQLIEKK